ncbi:response regulator [Wohlfahrtiimonas chitiniclastica]|uniref:response regulator n=1 Tax=Wohlfahrtiimonas chitiniclastica TaxID=400946 RepID=UPI000B97E6F9|nr:response regulator [Wohlfahrtiimonas chitiniclastica]OYQ85314.1 DNA-binding response regulator [Wohlfahrtiimonas chitiniclastica]OYQ86453.1 DNA-binding response regulator [Wohlfahrtiimonas chitiniclastica]
MEHILLVDDDLQLQALISELLTFEGFAVDVCNNGEECLAYMAHTTPDVLILDVMMPKKNGWDTLKEVRSTHPLLPVLMLSAKGDSIDRVLGLELGADDYIGKPFDDRELIARIRALLRRANAEEAPQDHNVIKVDQLELNQAQFQVSFAGKPIDLTYTEFSLLLYMVKNRGKAISRDELSREILGKRHQAFDRVIDMHVSNLRKKIPDRDNGMPWFKTIHGLGYMFIE